MTERTLFLADTHFRPRPPSLPPGETETNSNDYRAFRAQAVERLARFLETTAIGATRLVLLGDTFHCWFERDGRLVGDFTDILGLFRAAAARGLSIHHLSGNRDFAVGAGRGAPDEPAYPGFHARFRNAALSVLVDAGVEPHGLRYRFQQDGKTWTCLHGDTYCRNDYVYRFLRFLLQGLGGQALMAFGPFSWGAGVVGWFQTRPPRPPKPPDPTKGVIHDSVAEELADDGAAVICGHLHRAERRPLAWRGRRGELVVVPAWTNGNGYGELAGGNLEIRYDPEAPNP